MKLSLTSLLILFFIGKISSQTSDKTDSLSVYKETNPYHSYVFNIDDFKTGAIFTPIQLINGKVPGMAINLISANDPNPQFEFQTRGYSTIFLKTDPLYVIDGIPVENPDFIFAENIESMQVITDIAQTSKFGIRGVNGVIIINTKNTNHEKFKITYSSQAYVESFSNEPDVLSTSEWHQLKKKWETGKYDQLKDYFDHREYYGNTDWLKEISQNKISSAHNLSFSGGYNKTYISAKLNFHDNNGIILKTNSKSYGGQLSISQYALKEKLKITASLTGLKKDYSQINNNPFFITSNMDYTKNIISIAKLFNPTIPVYNSDGTFARDTLDLLNKELNPLEKIINTKDEHSLKNQMVSFSANYNIFKPLNIKAAYSNYKTSSNDYILFIYPGWNTNNQHLQNKKKDNKAELIDFGLSYFKSFENHNLNIVLNYSQEKNISSYFSADSVSEVNGRAYSYAIFNYKDTFKIKRSSGILEYNYKAKYYLNLGLTTEESPLYDNENIRQNYPSIGVAWSLGNEYFMKNLKWINNLVVKANYGFGQRGLKNAAVPARYYSNLSLIGDRLLHGEKITETNLGMELSLLSNRLKVFMNYNNRKAKDVIAYNLVLINFTSYLKLKNGAEIENKGLEFNCSANPLVNRIKWLVNFNFSFNRNKVLSSDFASLEKGKSSDYYEVNKFAGFSDLEGLLVYDKNGSTTSDLWDATNLKTAANGSPKSYYSLNNSFSYKNFDISIFVRGALGFKIKNLDNSLRIGNDNFSKKALSIDPRVIIYSGLLFSNTDYALINGNYLKIDNIYFGYNIPINKKLKSAKVYICINNVALFSKLKNGDPEMINVNDIYPGRYLYEVYPQTRIYLVGLNLTL